MLNFKELDHSFQPFWENGNMLLAYRTVTPLARVAV